MHCCWSHLPLLNPQSGARVLTWLTCQDVAMQGLCPPHLFDVHILEVGLWILGLGPLWILQNGVTVTIPT